MSFDNGLRAVVADALYGESPLRVMAPDALVVCQGIWDLPLGRGFPRPGLVLGQPEPLGSEMSGYLTAMAR
jgi:hypothetical protein